MSLLANLVPLLRANQKIASKILDSNLSDFSDQNNIITDLFQTLEELSTTKDVILHMSEEEFVQGMSFFNRGKSASHSGCHYSLYKVTALFLFTTSIIVKLINKCLINNIILDSWEKVV